VYDVGNVLGAYLVAERWAEPIDHIEADAATPLSAFTTAIDRQSPPNLKRESVPPYYDGPAIVLDRRTRRRTS